MSETWIVVADSSRARILTPSGEQPKPLDEIVHFVGRAGYTGPEKFSSPHLIEVADLVYPSARLQPHEVEADRPGRVKGPGANEPYDSRHTDFNHKTAEEFAREIIEYLTHARQDQRFDELVLVAPPLLLGVLRKQLPKSLHSLVTREIAKEYTLLPADEIRDQLAKKD